jgi:hypothetical protein
VRSVLGSLLYIPSDDILTTTTTATGGDDDDDGDGATGYDDDGDGATGDTSMAMTRWRRRDGRRSQR